MLFAEDEAGRLYARLKGKAAIRVGIEVDAQLASLADNIQGLAGQVEELSRRADLDAVMVQKPAKSVWLSSRGQRLGEPFNIWWQMLTMAIDQKKDVDCLTQVNLQKVYAGEWQILPATVKAVLSILEIALKMEEGSLTVRGGEYGKLLEGVKTAVVGRSDIVGRPLAAVLTQAGAEVSLCGSKTEDLGVYTCPSNIVVSATGVANLIHEDLIGPGSIVIDVGSPKGDVDFEAVKASAAFITPVPGGVGPMTVVSLLENMVELSVK